MSESSIQSKPAALLQVKTIQVRPVRTELRAGRRWKWWGKRGWWLRCSLLHEQRGTSLALSRQSVRHVPCCISRKMTGTGRKSRPRKRLIRSPSGRSVSL